MFALWPKPWRAYKSRICANWKVTRLGKASRRKIPKRSGIYTMLIQPGIAAHPAASFPMYVGQAKDLARRFNEYLTSERKPDGRPKIVQLLHKYDEFLWFGFCEVNIPDLDSAENALITAMDPPCNDRVEARLAVTRKAF